jgi:tetratricopeptide (TPR) repeat protein/tRNA A-37 threonylcarbamoyl transferase component Bud32
MADPGPVSVTGHESGNYGVPPAAGAHVVEQLRVLLRQDPLFDPMAELTLTRQEVLGRGGMGVVYKVRDERLGREAALKLMHPGGGPRREYRFRREARISARLDHPGIPPVYSAGRISDGQHYLLMRYVQGETLSAAIRRVRSGQYSDPGEAATERDLLAALVKVCEAVAYAHSRRVIHRDLKPDNVMLGAFGEVLVLDWGLARDLDESSASDEELRAGMTLGSLKDQSTQDGAVLGTLGYLPREQARGENLDARADVWALGAILCTILSGSPPYLGAPLEVLAFTLQDPPTLPGERTSVPPELNAIAAKALAVDQAERYAGADELAADLSAYLEGRPVSVFHYRAWEKTWRLVKRHPTLFALVAAAFLALIGGGFLVQASAQAAHRETVSAAREEATQAWAEFEGQAEASLEHRTAAALSALGGAQRWHALARDDEGAARARWRAACALGRLAQAGEQWTLAEVAFRDAARTDVDVAAVTSAQKGLTLARSAEARRRADRVKQLLADAESGALERRPGGYESALIELSRYRTRATATLLLTTLEGVSDKLESTLHAYWGTAAEPTPAERDLGQGPIEGLESVLVHVAAFQDASSTIDPGARQILRAALRRLAARGAAGRIDKLTAVQEICGHRQARALGAGALRAAKLCSEALGHLTREDDGAPQALLRYLRLECSGSRALPAALALARVGGPEVLRALASARSRFRKQGAFQTQLDQALSLGGQVSTETIPADNVMQLLQRARLLRTQGKVREALADYERAVKIAPDNHNAWNSLGVTRSELKDFAGAHRAMKRAIELRPDADYYGNRGGIYTYEGKFALALADLDIALRFKPDDVNIRMNRAELLWKVKKDLAGAERDFRHAVRVGPRRAAAWQNLGRFQLATGKPAEAVASLEQATGLAPRLATAWELLAKARHAAGRLDDAALAATKAISCDPRRPQSYNLRAQILAQRGDHRAAIEDLDHALTLKPLLPSTYSQRAYAHLALGNQDQALADGLSLVKVVPGNAEAHNALAEIYRRLGRPRDGLDSVQTALDLSKGKSGAYWTNRGRILLDLQRFADAKKDAVKGYSIAKTTTALQVLAQSALLAGDDALSRQAFTALARFPQHVFAPLWAHALGEASVEARLQTLAEADHFPAWLARLCLGKLSPAALLKRARASVEDSALLTCQVEAHLGLRAEVTGKAQEAREHYERALGKRRAESFSYELAKARLARLK